MLTRFKKTIGGFVLVIMTAVLCLSLAGCGKPSGTFYTLDELYDNGTLTREDVTNIAALRMGKVEVLIEGTNDLEEAPFDPIAPDVPLDEDTAKKIEYDFKAGTEGKFTEFEIKQYYGTYGGMAVVEIFYLLKNISTLADTPPLFVADIFLGFISRDRAIVAWRENIG